MSGNENAELSWSSQKKRGLNMWPRRARVLDMKLVEHGRNRMVENASNMLQILKIIVVGTKI